MCNRAIILVTSYTLNSGIILESGYKITPIEDENIPLAGGPGGDLFFLFTVAMIIVIGFLFVFSIYILECYKYRQQLNLLYYARTGKKREKASWKIQVLKDQIREEEAIAVAILLEEEKVLKNS